VIWKRYLAEHNLKDDISWSWIFCSFPEAGQGCFCQPIMLSFAPHILMILFYTHNYYLILTKLSKTVFFYRSCYTWFKNLEFIFMF
jgi:hypothetical protein